MNQLVTDNNKASCKLKNKHSKLVKLIIKAQIIELCKKTPC